MSNPYVDQCSFAYDISIHLNLIWGLSATHRLIIIDLDFCVIDDFVRHQWRQGINTFGGMCRQSAFLSRDYRVIH